MSKIMPHLVIIISCMLLVFLIIDHFVRKAGWVKDGDMKLS